MKYIISFAVLFVLTGCGPPITWATAPGAPLPEGVSFCTGYDAASRCTGWTSESDKCVNPKGINEPNPVVPCADIKQKKK